MFKLYVNIQVSMAIFTIKKWILHSNLSDLFLPWHSHDFLVVIVEKNKTMVQKALKLLSWHMFILLSHCYGEKFMILFTILWGHSNIIENGYMYSCSTILYFRNYWSTGSTEPNKLKYKITLTGKPGIYQQY